LGCFDEFGTDCAPHNANHLRRNAAGAIRLYVIKTVLATKLKACLKCRDYHVIRRFFGQRLQQPAAVALWCSLAFGQPAIAATFPVHDNVRAWAVVALWFCVKPMGRIPQYNLYVVTLQCCGLL
jgi:hypothetical protein